MARKWYGTEQGYRAISPSRLLSGNLTMHRVFVTAFSENYHSIFFRSCQSRIRYAQKGRRKLGCWLSVFADMEYSSRNSHIFMYGIPDGGNVGEIDRSWVRWWSKCAALRKKIVRRGSENEQIHINWFTIIRKNGDGMWGYIFWGIMSTNVIISTTYRVWFWK